jgi:type I restriction enzyme, S subunit
LEEIEKPQGCETSLALPIRNTMPSPWPLVPLGDVLAPSEEWIDLQPDADYQEVTVKLWGKGVVLRRQVKGAEVAAKRRLIVHKNQFILSRIDARNGAFGLIPDALDGAIVSNDFPVFNPAPSRILPAFLAWMSKTQKFVEICKAASEGTTNRVRLKRDRFLTTEIPLPPLDEQRRIVARIEALAAKVEEARCLRRGALEDADRLLITMAHRPDLSEADKRRAGWTMVNLGDVIRHVRDASAVELQGSYPNMGIFSFGKGTFEKPPILGTSTAARVLFRVRANQFIYSRLFAFEGAYAVVPEQLDGHFVSGEYETFECDKNQVTPAFLMAYFKLPSVWAEIAAGSKGLGDRRQRVHADHLLTHRLLLPRRDWQEKIELVTARTASLRRLQTQTTPELAALLPSILDKAFKGEL